MIFVTVGAQMPFDRLVHGVDRWAAARGRTDIFAQIGRRGRPPRHIRWTRTLEPLAFRENVFKADLVVAHAGMGTVITALELGRPLLVMPRRGDLRETRNDHQFATVRRLKQRGDVGVALDELELVQALDDPDRLIAPAPIASHATLSLLSTIRAFIRDGQPAVPMAPAAPLATLTPETSTTDQRRAA